MSNQSNLTLKSWNKSGSMEKYLRNRGNATIFVDDDAETLITVDACNGPGVFHTSRAQCKIVIRNQSKSLEFDNFNEFYRMLDIGFNQKFTVSSIDEFLAFIPHKEKCNLPDVMQREFSHVATVINDRLFINDKIIAFINKLILTNGSCSFLRENVEIFIVL